MVKVKCLFGEMSTGSMVNLCALVVFFTSYIVSVSARETPNLPDFATLCPHNDFCTSKAKSVSYNFILDILLQFTDSFLIKNFVCYLWIFHIVTEKPSIFMNNKF